MDSKFPQLLPILEGLVEKYRKLSYSEWEVIASNEILRHDYSEEVASAEIFWQAHTEVLRFESNGFGRYAQVSISIFPEVVDSSSPAHQAAMLVYESGFCEITTPDSEYVFDQESGDLRSDVLL